MRTSYVRHAWFVVFLLALGAAPPAEAQLSSADLRYRLGVAVPLTDFGEFFAVGPRFGVDVGYPLRDRLGVAVGVDLDQVGGGAAYVPTTRRLRYQAGIEADLLGDLTTGIGLRGYAGAGATTFRSEQFYVASQPAAQPQRFSSTYFTGTGGLRLAIAEGSDLVWWLSGDVSWSPISEEDTVPLSDATFGALSPFSSATDLSITIGVSLPR